MDTDDYYISNPPAFSLDLLWGRIKNSLSEHFTNCNLESSACYIGTAPGLKPTACLNTGLYA